MGDSLLIATAGHVDHGKSTLVRTLTGIDPDRWKEEKDRGITIDLGFAHYRGKHHDLSFVDVPGHERFIHNMLAGIGCIDGVLLVVAADESIMPQTREHAIALQYLGVSQVSIVLSKCDLVDSDLLDLVHAELDDWLPSLGWASAPRANFSSGDSVSKDRVLEILEGFQPKGTMPNAAFRMPIDRVFTSPGSGTVVTGTIDRGQIEKGDDLVLLPQRQTSRIRQIQVHGKPVAQGNEHQRAAINLADFHHSGLHRGQMLFTPPGAVPTQHLLVRLTHFQPWDPKPKHLFHLHHFSMHMMARMVWREDQYAMLSLSLEHPFWAMDKGLIRDGSPLQVIAGFEVVHPFPPTLRRQRWKPHCQTLDKVSDVAGWQAWFIEHHHRVLTDETILQYCGIPIHQALQDTLYALDSQHWLPKSNFLRLAERCLALLEEGHRERPLYNGLPLSWVRAKWKAAKIDPLISGKAAKDLQERGAVVLEEDRIKSVTHKAVWSSQNRALLDRLVKLETSQLPIIDLREFDDSRSDFESLVSMLVWERYLVSLTADLLIPSQALNQILEKLAAHCEGQADMLQVSDLKALFGLTRKVAIPLLEFLDRAGYTLRQGDGRRWLQSEPEHIVSKWEKPSFVS